MPYVNCIINRSSGAVFFYIDDIPKNVNVGTIGGFQGAIFHQDLDHPLNRTVALEVPHWEGCNKVKMKEVLMDAFKVGEEHLPTIQIEYF